MLDKVKVHCDECNENFEFYFGLAQELEKIGWFLNNIVKTQKNLLDFNVYWNEFGSQTQHLNKIFGTNVDLKQEYDQIMNFFSDEEKQLLVLNPLIGFDLSIYPVVLESQINQAKKELLHLPIVELNFIGKKKYSRSYPGVLYIHFNEEHTLFTCPNHLKLIAKRIDE
ncbi:Uncharacterised protein [Mycoplasmopsis citelli]|uniref:Uncharacterized protein n=1 Tax=Mycoplasmopsis citelli TaxID=171281 RepID=A0A449B256_9BACT|nr:hypothetical protein [Mycoplasmopsis citelli]VEU74689.1 Uncharacterised protein [Mycoplasmopsis citelli]